MADYFVQVEDKNRPENRTIFQTGDKGLADFIAGKKNGRVISKTALQKNRGAYGLNKAVEEAEKEGWKLEKLVEEYNK